MSATSENILKDTKIRDRRFYDLIVTLQKSTRKTGANIPIICTMEEMTEDEKKMAIMGMLVKYGYNHEEAWELTPVCRQAP